MESIPCQYVAQDFERVKKLTWSKSVCAPDNYNTIVRCTETVWSPRIYKRLHVRVNTVPSPLIVRLHPNTIYEVI